MEVGLSFALKLVHVVLVLMSQVMLADGLKVLKHHRRSSKRAASRVIRFVPDYGGALVWDKPLRQPGAKASRVPLDAISQVELEASNTC